MEYSSRCKTRAVLVVTSAIDINGIQVTKLASKLLMKSAGLSLDSLSHWALVAVDRGEGTCYLYDLMSDQMLPTTKIMKNYRMSAHFPRNPSRTFRRCLRPPRRQLTGLCSEKFPRHRGDGANMDGCKLYRRDYTDT